MSLKSLHFRTFLKRFLCVCMIVTEKSGDKSFPGARRFIGATLLTLTDSIVTDLKMLTGGNFPDVTHGVLIQAVTFNGPAHRSGKELHLINYCIYRSV